MTELKCIWPVIKNYFQPCYTKKIEKLRLLLELTLLEICAKNEGNSVSGDYKCKNFLGGACPQTPLEGITFGTR